MKQLMITVKPEYLVDILNGNKTLELRTYIPKDFVGWVNVYCGKGKPYLYKLDDNGNYYITNVKVNNEIYILNGKVVCRFWFDEHIAYKYYEDDNSYFPKRPQDFGYQAEPVLKRLCLTRDEFKAYGNGKDLYAWHIKQLEIFDEPKELGEFQNYYRKEKIDYEPLTHAPQKYAYVWGKEE